MPLDVSALDLTFHSDGFVGFGTSAYVFKCRKRSSDRVVAIKLALDDSQEEEMRREIRILKILNERDESNRDLGVVKYEQMIVRGLSCWGMVLQYAPRGTLADEIKSKSQNTHFGNVYTERRIVWYAKQLADTLAFCHERNVWVYDVKAANILVLDDHKLLLSDFGSAIQPHEMPVGLTEIYAAPELLQAFRTDDYQAVSGPKVDSFGLGCILFELVSCQKLLTLTGDQTLAEFLATNPTLDKKGFPCIRLDFLESHENAPDRVGYSATLKHILTQLLHPNPSIRWTPRQLLQFLQTSPLSPLVVDQVAAAKPPIAGEIVTIDNIQLGLLVQRGPDWIDGDVDGGMESIGVVVLLDPDGAYAQVTWPTGETTICRINGKAELQVAPWTRNECEGCGLIATVDVSKYQVGQLVGDRVVVGKCEQTQRLFVVPTTRLRVPTLPLQAVSGFPTLVMPKLEPVPENWRTETSSSSLVRVTDAVELETISNRFISDGMDPSTFKVERVYRIENPARWKKYATSKRSVRMEFWGDANERTLFLLADSRFQKSFASGSTLRSEVTVTTSANLVNRRIQENGVRQMLQVRASLGRTQSSEDSIAPVHSKPLGDESWTVGSNQVFPEYMITYRVLPPVVRRFIKAKRPTGALVECGICLEEMTSLQMKRGRNCKHEICFACFQKLRPNKDCPFCRRSLC